MKCRPRRLVLTSLPASIAADLDFVMKPPPCIVSLRKKVRGLKVKRRRPYEGRVAIGTLMLRIEAQAVTSRPPRRPIDLDRIKKSSRLETTVTRISSLPKRELKVKGKPSKPLIQIQSWDGEKVHPVGPNNKPNRKNSSHVGSGPVLVTTNPATGVTRVKSELCPVTETCTAATIQSIQTSSSSSTHSRSHTHKVKAETKHLMDSHPKFPHHPMSGGSPKTMPPSCRAATSGTPDHPIATSRQVPSPPRATTTSVPSFHISSAVTTVKP